MHHRQVIFWEIDVLAQAIQIAVNQINVAWNPKYWNVFYSKGFIPGLISQMKRLRIKRFENEYLPKKPKDVTCSNITNFLRDYVNNQ